MGMCIEASLMRVDARCLQYIIWKVVPGSTTRWVKVGLRNTGIHFMKIFSLHTRTIIMTEYLLLTCRFQQVVRREKQWAKGQIPLNTLHLKLRDIHIGKEGQKIYITRLLILFFF